MTRAAPVPGAPLRAVLPRVDELRAPQAPDARPEELRMRGRAPEPFAQSTARRNRTGALAPPPEPSPHALAALSAASTRLAGGELAALAHGLTPDVREALQPQLDAVAAMMTVVRALVGMREQVGAQMRAQGQG